MTSDLSDVCCVGGGPHSRVGVGGDSSGGRMAASVAHDVPGLTFQVCYRAGFIITVS
jgi:hypothetical protein